MAADSRNSRQVDFTETSGKKNLQEMNLMVHQHPGSHLWSPETTLGLLTASHANISFKKRT